MLSEGQTSGVGGGQGESSGPSGSRSAKCVCGAARGGARKAVPIVHATRSRVDKPADRLTRCESLRGWEGGGGSV